MAELNSTGALSFEVNGSPVSLTKEDLLIDVQQKEGYYSVSDNGITVALCTILTEDLVREGFVREVISKVQTMRKDSDFVVTDKIKIFVDPSDRVREILELHADKILPAVLGAEYTVTAELPEEARDWDINGESIRIYLERA